MEIGKIAVKWNTNSQSLVFSKVIKGDSRGKTLGYPTSNIYLDNEVIDLCKKCQKKVTEFIKTKVKK